MCIIMYLMYFELKIYDVNIYMIFNVAKLHVFWMVKLHARSLSSY